MLIELMELVVILWAAFDVIDRSVMLVTIFYFQRNVLKAWLQARTIRSDNHYLAAQITSFIVPYVQYVINSVLVHRLNSRLDYPTTRVTIKQKKRTCRLVNHFIDSFHHHQLSNLKFVLIEQVSTETEDFLEQREGYWQAQLWTCDPYGFNARKEFNSGRRREFLS